MTFPKLSELTIPVVPAMTSKKVERERAPFVRFLKGPIRWDWLARAASAPGSTLAVAIALVFEAGVTRSNVVKLPHARLREMNVKRDAAGRGLHHLEELGLAGAKRLPGRSPIVTLLGNELSGARSTTGPNGAMARHP